MVGKGKGREGREILVVVVRVRTADRRLSNNFSSWSLANETA